MSDRTVKNIDHARFIASSVAWCLALTTSAWVAGFLRGFVFGLDLGIVITSLVWVAWVSVPDGAVLFHGAASLNYAIPSLIESCRCLALPLQFKAHLLFAFASLVMSLLASAITLRRFAIALLHHALLRRCSSFLALPLLSMRFGAFAYLVQSMQFLRGSIPRLAAPMQYTSFQRLCWSACLIASLCLCGAVLSVSLLRSSSAILYFASPWRFVSKPFRCYAALL